ncbi:hypothetical protein ACQ4PT_017399 [Festuca glaucescens]
MEGALVQSAIVPTVYNNCAQVRGRARATAVRSMRTQSMTLGGFQGLRRANFLDTKSVVRRDFGSIVASQLARPRGKGSRMVVRAMFERFTEKAIKVIMLAQEEARRLGHNFVGTEQILLGLIGEGTGIAAKVLKSMGINLKDARMEVEKIIGRGSGFVAVEIPFTPRAKRVLELSLEEARQLGHNYIGSEHLLLGLLREGEVVKKMPTLEEYGTNLTKLAEEGKLDPVVGRQDQIERVTQILGRRTKNNPCLIGEPGVGKTAIAEGLAQRITNGDVPETIEGKKVITLDMGLLVAGTKYPEGAIDAANILKPALARGELQCIGATTLDDDRFLPDKAIDLIDEAGSRVRLRHAQLPDEAKELDKELRQVTKDKNEAVRGQDFEKAGELRDKEMELKAQITAIIDKSKEMVKAETESGEVGPLVTEADIQHIVSSWTGIPVEKVSSDESDRLLKMEETLHQRVIGQDEAVKAISRAIRRARVGLKNPNRPIASFIFSGPTGVGKSELAKTLASYYFGSEEAMVRLDMSEFMERHTVSKLIGSPPPDIVIEKGGRKIGFDLDYDEKDTSYNRIKSLVTEELKQYFRPEFLNRLDEMIVFRQLTKLEVKEIADIMLKEVFDRLKLKEIDLQVTERFRDRVVDEGYNPSYGARPLRRAIMRLLEDSLAEKMLAGEVKEGDSAIVDVDSEGKVIVLNGGSGVPEPLTPILSTLSYGAYDHKIQSHLKLWRGADTSSMFVYSDLVARQAVETSA